MTGQQTAIPASSEELEELLNDDKRMENIFAEGNFGEFTRAYQAAWASKNTEDVRAFKERLQLDYQNFMRDQAAKDGARGPEGLEPGRVVDIAHGRGPRRARAIKRSRIANAADLFDAQGLFDAAAPGAAEEIDNASYSDSLIKFVWAALKGEAVAAQNGDSAMIDELRAFKGSLAKSLKVLNANMSERIPSEGGFLIPETLRSEILALSLEESVMRPQATVIPMDSLRVPLPSIDDTSHTASVFGGVAAYWTAEGAALTATAPAFSRLVLEANKLTGFTMIPNELLQDSVSPMDVWFHTFFPQALAFFEDLAFLAGDGIDQPEGVLNCPGAVKITPAATASVEFADIAAMMARLWPPSLKRSMWICSPDVLPFLFRLGAGVLTGSGPTTTAVAPPLWLGGMQAVDAPGGSDGSGYNFRLMGRPLRVTEKVPYPGNTAGPGGTLAPGSLSLIDPTYYLLGDRQAMQVASSAEYSFANDEVAFRVIERVDGRGWVRSPLTPANGSPNTLSPYVLLNS